VTAAIVVAFALAGLVAVAVVAVMLYGLKRDRDDDMRDERKWNGRAAPGCRHSLAPATDPEPSARKQGGE